MYFSIVAMIAVIVRTSVHEKIINWVLLCKLKKIDSEDFVKESEKFVDITLNLCDQSVHFISPP